MSLDYEELNGKFKACENTKLKFMFALWYYKKINELTLEECKFLKEQLPSLESKHMFAWQTFTMITELKDFLNPLKLFLKSIMQAEIPKEDLSPVTKGILENKESSSPFGEILYRRKIKQENAQNKGTNQKKEFSLI